MNEKKTYEMDVAYDTVYGTFDNSLIALFDAIPKAEVRVLTMNGASGGWPTIQVTVSPDEIEALKVWYLGEDGDIEDLDDLAVTEM
jgi:hypothetical protein